MINDPKIFDRFLNILEVKAAEPSLELLKKIIKSHMEKIPFENISKLIYKRRGANDIPGFVKYLDEVENNNFGGTCYSLNYYLYLLLRYLGFNVKLCGADMQLPDVHLLSIVEIDNTEYIVDCGYGAPFIEPLPRNISCDYEINFGDEKYILKPKNADGTSRLEQYYKNELKHYYTVKPQARKLSEFKKVIINSYADDALFMNNLLITRHSVEYSISLRNFTLTVIKNNKLTQRQVELNEIPGVVNTYFGIPAMLVKNAIFRLRSLNSPDE